MRTRHGSYPSPSDGITFFIKPKPPLKRRKISSSPPSVSSLDHDVPSSSSPSSLFDSLHDDIIVSIMASLSSSAACPSDLINAMLTCKRFCAAGAHPLVLANASLSALAVTANKWCDGSHRFLRQCALSGNAEASYTLGMIRFYCFNEREIGASLMAQAAIAPHASSLHSLAIIQFNGSGGTRKDKNLKNGASLCAKAAALAHVDAMRELGHCLQDGYGVSKNVTEGRRLLLEANAREAAAAVSSSPRAFVETALQFASQSARGRCYFRHHQNFHNNSYRSILVSKPEVSAAMAARTITEAAVRSDVLTSHSAQASSSSSSVEVFSASRSNLEASASSGSLFTESFSASRSANAATGSIHVEKSASLPQESPAETSSRSASTLAESSRSVSMSTIVSPPSISAEPSNSSSVTAESIIPHAEQQPSIHLTFLHHNDQNRRQHHHHHHQHYHHQHQHHLHPVYRLLQGSGCSLLSDFGCNVPPSKLHVANKFLMEWFSSHPPSNGLRLCSHGNCGRPETRRHEFRRCSACGKVNYCSRACQALDWKIRHKLECSPVADWEEREDDVDGVQHHEDDDDNEHVGDT